MDKSHYPRLQELVENSEIWRHIRDLDIWLEESKKNLPIGDENSALSQIARNLHSFSWHHYYLLNIFLYKTKEIARGILQASRDQNMLVFFNLARAFMEHTASLAYQDRALSRAVGDIFKNSDLPGILKSVDAHQVVVQRIYYGGSTSAAQMKRLHVNALLEALADKYDDAKVAYDALCEFVHPNYGSNALVSSGILASGKIGSPNEFGEEEAEKARIIVEKSAEIGEMLALETINNLQKINNSVEICRKSSTKISQIFSLRSSHEGGGADMDDAIFFHKARTQHEAFESFKKFMQDNDLYMISRRLGGVKNGFLFDSIITNKGEIWFKYRLGE